MKEKRTIEACWKRLAIYLPASSWAEGLNFLTNDGDFIQVGTWGYEKGVKPAPHIHNEVRREVTRTQELIFIRSGRVAAYIYDEAEKPVERLELEPGDVLILLRGGHGYEVLEDGTRVLEVKNGPYLGPEMDRRRIEKEE